MSNGSCEFYEPVLDKIQQNSFVLDEMDDCDNPDSNIAKEMANLWKMLRQLCK
jgi:hypothetical protein